MKWGAPMLAYSWEENASNLPFGYSQLILLPVSSILLSLSNIYKCLNINKSLYQMHFWSLWEWLHLQRQQSPNAIFLNSLYYQGPQCYLSNSYSMYFQSLSHFFFLCTLQNSKRHCYNAQPHLLSTKLAIIFHVLEYIALENAYTEREHLNRKAEV